MKKHATITATKMAGENHAVHTLHGGGGDYCREVCPQCPWRVDQTGSFPAEAFLHSAITAYDMAPMAFACHMAGAETPKTCAGFILQGSADNLAMRMKREPIEVRETEELHATYKKMAVANGCDPEAPELAACMPEARKEIYRMRDLLSYE